MATQAVGRSRGEGTEIADFEAAFEHLSAVAYRVAFRILGSKVEAEDVSQEALAKAFIRWRNIEGYAEPWICRVTGNLAIDVVRRRRHTPVSEGVLEGTDQATVDRIELLRLLKSLPRRQREVLVLRYLADQSEPATAQALGCSVGSVKRHAHRALTTLRGQQPDQPERGSDRVRAPR